MNATSATLVEAGDVREMAAVKVFSWCTRIYVIELVAGFGGFFPARTAKLWGARYVFDQFHSVKE
jgi:hypothetical protein